jgi:hypothetical protein
MHTVFTHSIIGRFGHQCLHVSNVNSFEIYFLFKSTSAKSITLKIIHSVHFTQNITNFPPKYKLPSPTQVDCVARYSQQKGFFSKGGNEFEVGMILLCLQDTR